MFVRGQDGIMMLMMAGFGRGSGIVRGRSACAGDRQRDGEEGQVGQRECFH